MSSSPERVGPFWKSVAVVSLIVGMALRWWVLHTPMGILDGDEAISGLIARAAVHGHFSSFFWGQPYGGTLEPLLTAPWFAVFGSSPLFLKLVPMLLHLSGALVLGRIGRRVAGERAGIIAGSLWWCWPGAYVWWSTKSRGFYQATLLCSLLVVLLVLRLSDDHRSRRDWLALGFVVGIGWWQSPQIVLLAVPALLWLWWVLVVRQVPSWWKQVPFAAAAFLVGAAPWILFNIRNHGLSLRSDFAAKHGSYLDHLHALVSRGVPMITGVKQIYTERWIGGRSLALVLCSAIVMMAAFGVWLLRPRQQASHHSNRPKTPGGLLVVMTVAFPLIYAAFPNGLNVAEGRYQVFAAPLVVLGVASFAVRWRAPVLGASLLTGAVILSLVGLHADYGKTQPFVAGGVPVPRHFGPLIDALDQLGRPAIYTDYWVAGPLRFETRERIDAASVNFFRDIEMQRKVDRATKVAWVFVSGANDTGGLECALKTLHVGARRVTAAGFDIIMPDAPVRPGDRC